MEVSKYKEITSEFNLIIEAGSKVSKDLAGTQVELRHHGYADSIFTKLLCHALSLQRLSPKLIGDVTGELWDYPSACSVSRCIIEAHDVLEYIALTDIPEEERDFRLLVWELNDNQRRSAMLRSIKSEHPSAEDIHRKADELKTRAEQHTFFQKISKQTQKRISNGNAPSFLLSHKELNKVNGVNHDYHVTVTMMLSQYVHTLPMAAHQLQVFKAGTPDALHLSAMPVQYSLPFVSRAILRMVSVFPHGGSRLNEQELVLINRWQSIVEQGFNNN